MTNYEWWSLGFIIFTQLSCEQIVVLTFSLHAKFEEMIQIRCNKPKQCDLLIKDSIIHMDSLISLSTPLSFSYGTFYPFISDRKLVWFRFLT